MFGLVHHRALALSAMPSRRSARAVAPGGMAGSLVGRTSSGGPVSSPELERGTLALASCKDINSLYTSNRPFGGRGRPGP